MDNTRWVCDKCSEYINTPEEGYVEWYRDNKSNKLHNFHIVHQTKECMYDEQRVFNNENSSTPGNHLFAFLGNDGLIRLLRLLGSEDLLDRQEVINLSLRLQVPSYDTGLNRFDEAWSKGYINGPINGVYYPSVGQIEDINNEL
ncbi:hypothetical protein [Alkalibacterium olivapovliticus]|uniref:Uncharacterized protein n=1 Tax=Alkalibacterium olivapovliticus TaxID=99907 RepID=A0A2T0W860_9LACT|nr:hypothetical protein [Alkalibacterium olivapovliticus]PRY82872.1 hypothetical protein CLV38_10882 [Alkalibacterium olivapovliticus]